MPNGGGRPAPTTSSRITRARFAARGGAPGAARARGSWKAAAVSPAGRSRAPPEAGAGLRASGLGPGRGRDSSRRNNRGYPARGSGGWAGKRRSGKATVPAPRVPALLPKTSGSGDSMGRRWPSRSATATANSPTRVCNRKRSPVVGRSATRLGCTWRGPYRDLDHCSENRLFDSAAGAVRAGGTSGDVGCDKRRSPAQQTRRSTSRGARWPWPGPPAITVPGAGGSTVSAARILAKRRRAQSVDQARAG